MESMYQLTMALGCAAGLVALFALLRQALRSRLTPAWFASTDVAYISAVTLTLGCAGSLFYLGLALQPFVPAAVAFVGTFVIHLGFVALVLKVLPVDEIASSRTYENAAPASAVRA